MTKKHIKLCCTSLVIKEMKIKTMLWFHIILVRMAIKKNMNNSKCWQSSEKKKLSYAVGGNKKSTNIVESRRLLKKLLHDPAVPILGTYWKEWKSGYNKDTCSPTFIAALYTVAKLWKQSRCPTTYKWIKKKWYTYIYIYVCIWFEGKWVHFDNIKLNEVSQAQKDKGHMFSLICGK
jgi:hypothetical protein